MKRGRSELRGLTTTAATVIEKTAADLFEREPGMGSCVAQAPSGQGKKDGFQIGTAHWSRVDTHDRSPQAIAG